MYKASPNAEYRGVALTRRPRESRKSSTGAVALAVRTAPTRCLAAASGTLCSCSVGATEFREASHSFKQRIYPLKKTRSATRRYSFFPLAPPTLPRRLTSLLVARPPVGPHQAQQTRRRVPRRIAACGLAVDTAASFPADESPLLPCRAQLRGRRSRFSPDEIPARAMSRRVGYGRAARPAGGRGGCHEFDYIRTTRSRPGVRSRRSGPRVRLAFQTQAARARCARPSPHLRTRYFSRSTARRGALAETDPFSHLPQLPGYPRLASEGARSLPAQLRRSGRRHIT